MTKRFEDIEKEHYTEMALIYKFDKLDKKILNIVFKNIEKMNLDDYDGVKTYRKMQKFFSNIVLNRMKKDFGYFYKNNIRTFISTSLFDVYKIIVLILKSKTEVSPEEAVFEICTNKIYNKFIIGGWKNDDYWDGFIRPSVLILTISYLSQLGYRHEIKNKEIYYQVKEDFNRYNSWYKKFRPITKEQFFDPDFNLYTCTYKKEEWKMIKKHPPKECPYCKSQDLFFDDKIYEIICKQCRSVIKELTGS